MAVTVLEICPAHHGAECRVVCLAADNVRVGRAYDNDVIVADPYVAAHHLLICALDDGNWQVRDQGSENGTFVGSDRVQECVLGSGAEILIGRTRLRLLRPQHTVPAARPLRNIPDRLSWLDKGSVLAAVMALHVAAMVFYQYLEISSVEDLRKYWASGIAMGLGGLLFMAVLAGFWALVGRLVCHRARFRLQFVVLGLVIFVSYGFWFVLGYAVYLLDNLMMARLLSVIGWAPFLYLLYLNLGLATHLSGVARRNSIAVIVLLALGMSVLGRVYDTHNFRSYPDYSLKALPPLLGSPGGRPPPAFFERAAAVFDIDSAGEERD